MRENTNSRASAATAARDPFPFDVSSLSRAQRRLTLLVLDLGLDVVDGVGRLDVERDGLAGEGLDEDLHVELCVLLCGGFCFGDGVGFGE